MIHAPASAGSGAAAAQAAPDRPIRVLHCPTMVGGNPQELARAERTLGLHSVAVAFEETRFRYGSDEVLWQPGESKLAKQWKRFKLIWRALRDFDIIHFNYGRTILPIAYPQASPGWKGGLQRCLARGLSLFEMHDLALLKRAGKGIVVSFQGDDARQGDFCRAHFDVSIAGEVGDDYYPPLEDQLKRRRIARYARHADRLYALNPDLLHVLPARAEFLPYSHINLADWQPAPVGGDGRRLTVLHAPSHRGAKGTRYIVEAVERLQREGCNLEFLLVENLPVAEARRLYERADLLIDQLLAGWYGGLAVELMALGKPVIAYIRDEDLRFVPPALRADLPIISACPSTIHAVLKEWVTVRRGELPALGQRSRAYVDRWHDSTAIARRMKAEYENMLGRPRSR